MVKKKKIVKITNITRIPYQNSLESALDRAAAGATLFYPSRERLEPEWN